MAMIKDPALREVSVIIHAFELGFPKADPLITWKDISEKNSGDDLDYFC